MRNSKISAFQTCNQLLQWMDANEDVLPVADVIDGFSTDAQRAEYHLRWCFNKLTPKTAWSPEVLDVLDQICQHRRRRAYGTHPSSITKCKKVLEWMDAHEDTLPALLSKPITEIQGSELLLRRQYNYLKRKTHPSPDLRAVLEEIHSRLSLVFSATTTCKKVLEWMNVHKRELPKEIRKPTTDAHRAENRLRNKLNYLKRKTDNSPEVLTLIDKIKSFSLQAPELKRSLTVSSRCPSSEDSESFELPVFKRRRLLVKTKSPSLAVAASEAAVEKH
jgi:hypothetical protein